MDLSRESQRRILEQVRETLDEELDAEERAGTFHVTVAHEDGVEYMVSTAADPAAEPDDLLECLAADVTAVSTLLDEEPESVARSAGRMAGEKPGVGKRWDSLSG